MLFLLIDFISACRTALMLAALGRHTDCVHILLEKGAKTDAADKKGFTALHRAVSVSVCECHCFKHKSFGRVIVPQLFSSNRLFSRGLSAGGVGQ